MKAIIVTGGKQYTVSEGDVLFVEKLNVEAEETVKFEQVLAVIDGETVKIGTPVVEGAAVEAKVRVGEEEARITLKLPKTCDEEETVQAVLAGMMVTLINLQEDYSDFIEVLEV